MFRTKRISNSRQLDEEIKTVTGNLAFIHPKDEAYEVVAANLNRLYEIRDLTTKSRISPDTVAIIAANLLGIGLILRYEELDVISTKAMSFVMKGRV